MRLLAITAHKKKTGYFGVSIYGNGGAIYLISTGSTVNEHNAKFGRDEIEFVGFNSHNTKLKVINIPADNQEGIYARFA